MKQNKKKRIGRILLISGAALLGIAAVCIFCAWKEAASHIGIIGGADAPTAILLIQQGAFLPEIASAGIGLAGIVTGIILCSTGKN